MHAADFMNNIKVNNLWQSLSNSPACSFFTNFPFLMVQLQMTFFCNILQHYQLLFVDFIWMVSALLRHEYIHSDSVICLPSFV
jgi:hypothetical protein